MSKVQSQYRATILYVDDDQENLKSFKAIFRREYNVHLANSAQKALDILDRKEIQVLITDQRMPEMTGSELLEAVAEKLPDMLRFMLTGFSDFDPLVRALNEGMLQGYFSKPIDVRQVKERIETGLSKYYLKRQNQELYDSLRESEQQIRLQLSELEQVYAAAPVGLILVDREYRIVRINEKLAEIDGCSVEEHLGKTLDEVVPELADLLKSIYRPVLENGEPVINIAISGVTPKAPGIQRDWLCSYYPFKNNDEVILGVIGGIIEVTELKKAEEKARKARRFSDDLMQTANVVIISLDKEGYIRVVNPMAEKVTGYTTADLIGKNWFELAAPRELCPNAHMEFSRLMEGGFPRVFEYPIRTKDGGEKIISWSNKILKENGIIVGALSVGIDITQRRAAEDEKKRLAKQLRHAQKMEAIGTLAGGIAHDFNNILSPILGYAEIILGDSEPESDNRNSAQEIMTAGMRARDLVNQILTFSREREQERTCIKIQPVIQEALKLLRASMPVTIELNQRIDSECGPILADPTQIFQVVMNLCTNAYQAMQQGGRIEVHVRESVLTEEDQSQFLELAPGPYVRLSVSDTGPGIDPEIIDHIFDPYFSTKRMKSGTGLGLSVVHGIVKGHSGTIKVYSEPGQGASFIVFLPLLVDRKRVSAKKTDETIVGGTESVLLVDDEAPIVTVTQKILERLGYQVTGMTGSRKALSLFKMDPNAYDLILSDMTMPHLNGLEMTKAALAERSDIPVIICTGFSELINPILVEESGVRAVVMKPIVKNELAKTIRKVLDGDI